MDFIFISKPKLITFNYKTLNTVTKYEITNVTMYCYHHRISCALIWNYFPELRELEVKRDAFEIPNEESITAYYKIRQQLKRLGNDMLVSIWLSCCQKFVRALLKGKSVWFFSFFFFFRVLFTNPSFVCHLCSLDD